MIVFGFVILEDALFRLFQKEIDLELLEGRGVTVGSSPLLVLPLLLRFELLLLRAESRDLVEETLFELGDLFNRAVFDRVWFGSESLVTPVVVVDEVKNEEDDNSGSGSSITAAMETPGPVVRRGRSGIVAAESARSLARLSIAQSDVSSKKEELLPVLISGRRRDRDGGYLEEATEYSSSSR